MTEPALKQEQKPTILLVGFDFFDKEWLCNYHLVYAKFASDIAETASEGKTSTIVAKCDSENQFQMMVSLKKAHPALSILIVAAVDTRKAEALKHRCGFVCTASSKEAYGVALAAAQSMASRI